MKKKYIFLTFILTLVIPLCVYGSSVDEEAWIGAIIYKNSLSPPERFFPFCDIREKNFRINYPDNAIRTILADYFLVQEFNLIKELQKYDLDDNETNLFPYIMIIFSNITDKKKYERMIHELQVLVMLKKEVGSRIEYLKKLGLRSNYDTFIYRFLHLQITRFETYSHKDKKYRYDTPYTFKLEAKQNELRDSIIQVNNINSMIPIEPQIIDQYISSPLVSEKEIPMDLDYKNALLSRFGDRIRFIWKRTVNVNTFICSGLLLDQVHNYFNLFKDNYVNSIQDEFENTYGYYDMSGFSQYNLSGLLKNIYLN